MRKFTSIYFAFLISESLFSQNPIVSPGVYIADPSAHVWKDGKLYVYGSRDESPDYYCSCSYHVLSTSDLKTWTIHENSFASKGPGDQVSYSDSYLYAPDAQFKNGEYYLYYCLASRSQTEGVAVSSSPTGPFLNGIPIKTGGINQIDPCLFIDDDGQGYYVWGQFNAKMARMKPDMMGIDTTTIRENVVTEEKHNFHEGSYMIKHKGLYYLIYADVSRGGAPTCIGYSFSRSPMGPYTYGGVIIDNKFCDPAVWNNHGSLVEFKGQWYVFYHRATNGSTSMRKACLEPITFRKDRTIPEVQMTSQGAAGPLNAFKEIDAARACLLTGEVRIKKITFNNEVLGDIQFGDKVAYKYLDFKEGADSILIRVAPGEKPCRIRISAGSTWTGSIGSVDVPAKRSDEWITVKAPVKLTKGVHTLWFSFSDPSAMSGFSSNKEDREKVNLCQVDAFQFR